jgi:hypothetical protein
VAENWRVPGFTELRELGAGGQGRAVLVREDASGRVAVLKYVFADASPEARELFRRESALLKLVSSPHVARWFGHFEDESGSAILMEAVDGCSLKALLAEYGPLTPEASLIVLKGSLLGLAAAHQAGVVHRDYKPPNVVVRADGCSKLIDFGVSVFQGESSRSGTPPYMAPEQWRGEPATPATDIYSATCVFFECVTGHRPYEESDPVTLMARHSIAPVPVEAVPEPLRTLVERGMAKRPETRPADAETFVAELEAAATVAYGSEWEGQGIAALSAAAAALATLFPLAALSLGGAGGAGAGGAAGTAAGAAGQGAGQTVAGGLAKVGAGKVALAVAGAAVAAVGATAVVVTTQHKSRPVAEHITVGVRTTDQSFTAPRLMTEHADYVTVSGMRNKALQETINKKLAAPVDQRVAYIRKSLDGYPADPRVSADRIKAQVLLRTAKLVSVRYSYSIESWVLSHSSWWDVSTITVALGSGRTYSGRETFRPGLDTAELTRRLQSRVPYHRFCSTNLDTQDPIIPADALGTYVHPVFAPDHVEVDLNLPGLGYTTACGSRTAKFPYSEITDLLAPELVALLPLAPTPARS